MSVVLLDEELALLLPGAAPLPWLDAQAEQEPSLLTAARGLLLRGLATWDGAVLLPAGELAELLDLRTAAGPTLTLTPLAEDADAVLVVRPAGADGLLLHEIAGDGTHRLERSTPRALAEALLVGLAPPCEDGTAVLLLTLDGPCEQALLVRADHRVARAEQDRVELVESDLSTVLHQVLAMLPRGAATERPTTPGQR